MYIIHGDNTAQSRKKLDEVLTGKNNIKWFDGKKLKPDDVKITFSSTELFAEEKCVVIENCKGISKQVLEELVKVSNDKNVLLIFWQDGNYDARMIKKFSNAQVFSFPLPKYYFEFLDSLAPGNGLLLHNTYEKLLQSFVPEQVFFSMIKRMRQLLILKSEQEIKFEEFAKMSTWQKQKLKSQANKWDKQNLQNFYTKLYKIESRMKSSELPTNLEKHIDILLLSELH